MGEFSIGQSVRRREDPRLLMGRGRYFDDLKLADQFHAAIVRSPHAHADIREHRHARRAADARRACGADRQGLRGRRARHDAVDGALQEARRQRRCTCRTGRRSRSTACCMSAIRSRSWSPTRWSLRAMPPNASRSTMRRGPRWCRRARRSSPARRSSTTIARTTRRISTRPATRPRPTPPSPSAAHVIEQRLVINRVTANTLEPRGVTGEYDRGTGRYTLHCGFQRPWLFRNAIAETTMKIPEAQLRLITGDIGGSLRPARLDLSGDHPDAVGGAPRRPAGEMDLRRATKRTSATTTPATTSSTRRWRSTRTASSSACASAASATSAPSCRSAAPCRRWSTSARSAASTPRRRCTSRSPAC